MVTKTAAVALSFNSLRKFLEGAEFKLCTLFLFLRKAKYFIFISFRARIFYKFTIRVNEYKQGKVKFYQSFIDRIADMLNSTEVASSKRMGGLRGAFLLLPEYLAMEFFCVVIYSIDGGALLPNFRAM